MTPEQSAKLLEPFKPEQIGKLPKVNCKACTDANKQQRGTTCSKHTKINCKVCGNWISEKHIHLDYVGHAVATARLLDVDPEWTWAPVSPEEAQTLPNVSNGMWIKLTVCGVTRFGFGDGDNPKERIGDAIRNAAMRFGVALDLWAKEDLHANESDTDRSDPESSGPAVAAQTVSLPAGSEPSFLVNADIEAMSGPQLIEALRERGLQLGGTIPEMRSRLAAA